MAAKIKALQQWCRKMTDGYRDVEVKDFTVSWRSGMAFCAIIHRFRPDLIDYDSLSKENVFENNDLAFTVAEQELDIAAFLEAADMVALKTPDKLSVITYVSQYYNKLSPLPQLGGPGVKGKTSAAPAVSAGTKRHQAAEPLSEPETKKQPPAKKVEVGDNSAKVRTLGDRCAICNNKVYLLERHVEDGKLYHRSCYRHSDLSPTNKVYTRSPFMSPSLHGKDGAAGKSDAAASSGDKGPSSKTHAAEDKHGTKRSAEDEGGKSGLRKFLFSKDSGSTNKSSDHNKAASKDSGLGKTGVSKDSQYLSDHTAPSSKVASGSQADAKKSEAHTSMDFLSAGNDVKDVKSPKRQLPLIFQGAGSSGDGATDETKKSSEDKTSLFSKKNSDSSSVSSGLLEKRTEKNVKPVEKTFGSNSKTSVFPGSSAKSLSENKLFDKSKQPDKNSSEIKLSDKSSGPVAKPRNVGKTVPGTSEVKQERSKSPGFPKPSPRSSVPSVETGQKLVTDITKSPPAPRKVPARSKSPVRDLSPPPLPSSAPPPLPKSPPNASFELSLKHVSSSTSPQASPRNKSKASKFSTSASSATPTTSSQHVTLSSSSKPSSSTESNIGLSTPSHKPGLGISSRARHEEPMEIETALSKARSQYREEPIAVMVVPAEKEQKEKTTLTGLLKSLAQVRNTNTSTNASTTNTSSPHAATSREDKTSGTATASSAQSKSSLTGFVSNKISHMNAKDSDHKPASGLAGDKYGKHSTPTYTDGPSESSGKSTVSALQIKIGDTSHKDAEKQSKTSPRSLDIPVSKLGDTVTIKLNTDKKTVGDTSKPVSTVSEQKQNGKILDRVPLYKKKTDSHVPNTTNKFDSSPKQAADKDIHMHSVDISGKKDRPKSAADIFSVKDLSTPKEPPSSKDTSHAPAFTQVKLRESGNSTLERNDRAKSTGNIFEASGGLKLSWQQEAERKMAIYRDGFVDPETKKTVGKSDSPREDDNVIEKPNKSNKKEAPPRPAPVAVTNISSEKKELQKPKEVQKKSDEVKDMPKNIFKRDSPTSSGEQAAEHMKNKEEKNKSGINLKGILKSRNKDTPSKSDAEVASPPQKPERRIRNEKKDQLEIKVTPPVIETPEKSPFDQKEVSGAKKKITVSGLRKDSDLSHKPSSPSPPSSQPSSPPARPPPPLPNAPSPIPGRKKISVDVAFDFNMSNSLKVTDLPQIPAAEEKLTPPSRPPAPHRTSMSPARLSAIELQQQLLDIDCKLSELELRGRHLEDSIRSVAAEEEDEDLMVEWFQLVTEKNDLVRKECDLVYMSREQDLEDEQSQIESQLRYLLSKEENDKSFEEQQEEEYLIQRKLNVVNQRNSIVESMDEDRLRYEEEDRDIAQMLQEKGFVKDGSTPTSKEKGKVAVEKKVGSSKFYA